MSETAPSKHKHKQLMDLIEATTREIVDAADALTASRRLGPLPESCPPEGSPGALLAQPAVQCLRPGVVVAETEVNGGQSQGGQAGEEGKPAAVVAASAGSLPVGPPPLPAVSGGDDSTEAEEAT